MPFWKRTPDPKSALKERIGDYELPSFSGGAVSTLGLLRDEADMQQIAERLATDPGLSVRVLRTVNSAAFGMRQEVTDLVHAVSLLGRSRVEALVLTAAVGEALPTTSAIDVEGFWRTSAQRACLARKITADRNPSEEMQAFTAGLLQDMAIPFLAAAWPERYGEIYRTSGVEASCDLRELEKEALGFDHAEIGALMAESWELPEALITAIADHHDVGHGAPEAVEAVALIRHAEPPDELEPFRTHCCSRLALGADALEHMIEAANAEATSLGESLSR